MNLVVPSDYLDVVEAFAVFIAVLKKLLSVVAEDDQINSEVNT